MTDKLQKFFEQLPSFIIIGVVIALVFSILSMFFYLAIWGVIIGALLWLIAVIKHYFFPEKPNKNQPGRIIEHDDQK